MSYVSAKRVAENDTRDSLHLFSVAACQTAVHKKCHDKLLTKCPESGRESENTIVSITMSTDSTESIVKVCKINKEIFIEYLPRTILCTHIRVYVKNNKLQPVQ